jgi:hypothetical protein
VASRHYCLAFLLHRLGNPIELRFECPAGQTNGHVFLFFSLFSFLFPPFRGSVGGTEGGAEILKAGGDRLVGEFG